MAGGEGRCGADPAFDWVLPDLAVGGSFPAEAAAALACDFAIGAVIDVRLEACDDAEGLAACGLRFLHLPTEDVCAVSQEMLDEGVAFARRMAAEGRRLLIHCEHGIGRSATVALCVLVDRGHEPLKALRLAKDAREKVSPSRAQFEAWSAWLARRGAVPLSYDAYGRIAYRHLAASA